jgi:hypothetical protein
VAVAASFVTRPGVAQQSACSQLVLYNGKIATMDARNTMATSITIRGDRIQAVGTTRGVPKHDGCARLIDLRGRTVLPGIIDSHNHLVQISLRPGRDMREIENAFSIPELQQAIRAKAAAIGATDWITAIGGWAPSQFTERRMPTLAELDVAAPNHPVYLQSGFTGPSVTNSKGKAFLDQKGVPVGADGAIGANAPSSAAWNALKALQTDADRLLGAVDAMAYAARMGLTMSADKGGSWPADTPGAKGLALVGPGASNEINPFTAYDAFLALAREDRMAVRLRVFFYMQDLTPQLPFLAARFNNQFVDFGNDWLRVSGVGERIHAASAPPEVYEAAVRLTAQKRWTYDQHANDLADQNSILGVWERINATFPLKDLRWCLAHVPGIDVETLNRVKALGAGVSITGGRYLSGTPGQPGSPFRRMLESGVPTGYGGDGGSVAPISPWPHLYYLVTGRNSAGAEVEPAEQRLTRMEALRVYTVNQGWFTKEEQRVGSIETGKLADVVVLSDDVLDPQRVPDAMIRRIKSVLTIVGGRIVYDAGLLPS